MKLSLYTLALACAATALLPEDTLAHHQHADASSVASAASLARVRRQMPQPPPPPPPPPGMPQPPPMPSGAMPTEMGKRRRREAKGGGSMPTRKG